MFVALEDRFFLGDYFVRGVEIEMCAWQCVGAMLKKAVEVGRSLATGPEMPQPSRLVDGLDTCQGLPWMPLQRQNYYNSENDSSLYVILSDIFR